jgi:hypothetical protein
MPSYSPLLAIATGLFEFGAAGFALRSPGRRRILRPTALIFLLLAGYQFAEVAVCAAPDQRIFTRLAFFDISWLPPLGLWLMVQLVSPRRRALAVLPLAWFAAAVLIVTWIFIDPGCLTKSVCQTVIARYAQARPFEILYGVFYQSGLGVLIFGTTVGLARDADPVLRRHLADLQAGVLGFVLPSLAVRVLLREPQGVLPSIQCHFALILAVFLLSLVLRERKTSFRPAL